MIGIFNKYDPTIGYGNSLCYFTDDDLPNFLGEEQDEPDTDEVFPVRPVRVRRGNRNLFGLSPIGRKPRKNFTFIVSIL